MISDEYCLQCKTEKLRLLPELLENISFFECPNCKRNFAKTPEKQLHDRWGSPLSILLYPIIFDKEPLKRAAEIAEQFIKHKSQNEIDLIISETERELKNPTQRVSDILELTYQLSEEEVRNYLKAVVNYLKEFKKAN